jgi:hypothetical protein
MARISRKHSCVRGGWTQPTHRLGPATAPPYAGPFSAELAHAAGSNGRVRQGRTAATPRIFDDRPGHDEIAAIIVLQQPVLRIVMCSGLVGLPNDRLRGGLPIRARVSLPTGHAF